MAKPAPKPTRFLVFSDKGNPVADVTFSERESVIAGLPDGIYRGVSRDDVWILGEEEIRVPANAARLSQRVARPQYLAKNVAKAQQDVANIIAKKLSEERILEEKAIEKAELERVRLEASEKAEYEWREKRKAEAAEAARREREAAQREREREEEAMQAMASKRTAERAEAARLLAEDDARREREFSDMIEDQNNYRNYKPVPIPSLPTKLPPAVEPAIEPEPVHPLLARIKFRTPVQGMIIESLMQEFLHEHSLRIAEHDKKFSEIRSSVDLLDQTMTSAMLEDFLLSKRPLLPIDRKGQPSDVRAAVELYKLAFNTVPMPEPTQAKSAWQMEPRVGVWNPSGSSWKCGCDKDKETTPRDKPECKHCGWQRPMVPARIQTPSIDIARVPEPVVAPAPAAPRSAGPEIHEVKKPWNGASANGKYLNTVPAASMIPIISETITLKAPLLKAESQSRPVLIVGGVEAPEQTAWFRRALGGAVLWKPLKKHAGMSAVEPVVRSVAERRASAVIMLEELISHRISDQVKKAAKSSGVPYVHGGKAGRGRLEQAVQAIERYMESHQEAKKL